MHKLMVSMLLAAGLATPALAQPRDTVERRVDRIEQQLRAVQRRVFPDGAEIDPEIGASRPAPPTPGFTGDALQSLVDRVDAIEVQLRVLTSQVEEQGNRQRQLEQDISRLRSDLAGRVERLEQQNGAVATPPPARPRPEPRAEPVQSSPPAAEPAAPAAADAAQEAYNAGYRLWEARLYTQAQTALEAAATRYPNSRWTSWMRNLQGRAHLDDNRPATAARIFLANYQENPRGERAADSLYFLGQSLTRLNRRAEACRVYDELAQVYPEMRDWIRTRLPQARTDARCSANPAR